MSVTLLKEFINLANTFSIELSFSNLNKYKNLKKVQCKNE
jgi:hypothetical protein